jgi:hypothetical protein
MTQKIAIYRIGSLEGKSLVFLELLASCEAVGAVSCCCTQCLKTLCRRSKFEESRNYISLFPWLIGVLMLVLSGVEAQKGYKMR